LCNKQVFDQMGNLLRKLQFFVETTAQTIRKFNIFGIEPRDFWYFIEYNYYASKMMCRSKHNWSISFEIIKLLFRRYKAGDIASVLYQMKCQALNRLRPIFADSWFLSRIFFRLFIYKAFSICSKRNQSNWFI
jgi:hypothetical protein